MGLSRTEIVGRRLDELLKVTPSRDEVALLAAIQSGSPLGLTHGTLSPLNAGAFPAAFEVDSVVRDGNRRGVVCTIINLTDRAKSEQLQDREIGHRVRNIFAITQAIVAQTLRGIDTPRETIHAINQRIGALSGVNTLMMRTRRNNVSIRDVVESAVAMHRGDPERIMAKGDGVEVNGKAALAISLALHELCTNAIRHGALSNDDGFVTITWSGEEGDGAAGMLRMAWREQSGPAVTEPTRKGLGTRLIVESLSSDVQGRSELTYLPEGARWLLEAPLSVLRD
jgi:two-component sensor histidine kinase